MWIATYAAHPQLADSSDAPATRNYSIVGSESGKQYLNDRSDREGLVQEGRRQEAGGRRDIACTVSFLTFLNWWVISAVLY